MNITIHCPTVPMLAVMVTMLLVCVLLVMVGRNIEMDEEEWEQAGDLQF